MPGSPYHTKLPLRFGFTGMWFYCGGTAILHVRILLPPFLPAVNSAVGRLPRHT